MSIRIIPVLVASMAATLAAGPAFASVADAQKLPPCVKDQPIPPGGCHNIDPTPPPGSALNQLHPAPPLNSPNAPVPVQPAPPLVVPNAPGPVPAPAVPPALTPRAPSTSPRTAGTS